jgi:hypothetical protein
MCSKCRRRFVSLTFREQQVAAGRSERQPGRVGGGKEPGAGARAGEIPAIHRTLALLTSYLGAKMGANIYGHPPTPGRVLPQLTQAVATPGTAWPCVATGRPCMACQRSIQSPTVFSPAAGSVHVPERTFASWSQPQPSATDTAFTPPEPARACRPPGHAADKEIELE